MSLSRHGGCQNASHLLSLVIPWDYRRPLPLVQASNTVIVLSSLSSGTSGRVSKLALWRRLVETSALARPVLNGVRIELWHKGPPSSLCSGSSSRVPTLARTKRKSNPIERYGGGAEKFWVVEGMAEDGECGIVGS
ncbi:hypothetical protein Acr_28g0003060 [Actinidia rufa]|uniref:Uncharacterized protein n=1 Tax=Actinidia rufa TaxID=165716 RepID=A0A7J0H9H5_9ERIC|nr:hypothetical protein Acr_28g0003060 [Actinidia rufa]